MEHVSVQIVKLGTGKLRICGVSKPETEKQLPTIRIFQSTLSPTLERLHSPYRSTPYKLEIKFALRSWRIFGQCRISREPHELKWKNEENIR